MGDADWTEASEPPGHGRSVLVVRERGGWAIACWDGSRYWLVYDGCAQEPIDDVGFWDELPDHPWSDMAEAMGHGDD